LLRSGNSGKHRVVENIGAIRSEYADTHQRKAEPQILWSRQDEPQQSCGDQTDECERREPRLVSASLIGNSAQDGPGNCNGDFGDSHGVAPQRAAERFVAGDLASEVRGEKKGENNRWKGAVCPVIECPR
jgi:hypothetical protein